MDESSHSFLFVIQTRKIGNLVSVLTQDLKLQKIILIFYIKDQNWSDNFNDIQ